MTSPSLQIKKNLQAGPTKVDPPRKANEHVGPKGH